MKNISTEKINNLTKNIDQQPTEKILQIINKEDRKVAFAIESNIDLLKLFIKDVINCLKNDGKLVYVGAGTSGRLALVNAANCSSAYGFKEGKIIAIIAGGRKAFLKPIEKAEDNEALGEKRIKEISISDKDIVLGISASGRTPFVIGSLKFAKEKGAIVGALSNSKNAKINKYAKHKIFINTGPEVIAGSTRMKAGTSQKLVLDMIIATVMIKLRKYIGIWW